MQPQYISQTLVLVEQQKVPESYVKPVVTEDLSGRLASMKEQILSRSRLQPIIERFNLFANGKLSMDDRIDLTRKNIGITPIQSEIARTERIAGILYLVQGQRCAYGAAGVRGDPVVVCQRESERPRGVGGRNDGLSEGTTGRCKGKAG